MSDSSDLSRLRALVDELYAKSIPQLFWERCERSADAVAFRYEERGIYREVTWRRYREEVESFCLGLLSLGLQPGERVAIMGDPCPEWLIGAHAVLSAGAICYGIYTTCSPAEVCYQLQDGGAVFLIAEDQEYVDKVLAVADRLPCLRKVIVGDMRAMFLYDDPRIMSFAEVQARGRDRARERPGEFLERIQRTRATDVAVFVYTSGTTGPPKAAMHTHGDLMVGMTYPYLEGFPELRRGTHRTVSHLALAHLVEFSMTLCLPLIADVIPHIGEEVDNLNETLYVVQPTFFHAVPRIWEKIASRVLVGIAMTTPTKRLAYRLALAVARRALQERRSRGGRLSLATRVLARLAYWGVFRHILTRVGLAQAQAGLTAGAPIPEPVQQLWQLWGVNLRNLYGITEGTLVSCQIGDFPIPGNAGRPLYPKEVRLADDGEILVRGRGLFVGYWNQPEASSAAVKDGWLFTGDVAEWTPEGNLRLIDRKKDIMITAGGKNITPTEIENLIKSSPYISEAILIADGRPFPSALIEVDFDTLSEWARHNGVMYTGYTSLATHPRTYELIADEIGKANAQLARVEQVKKFRIIPKALDPEEGDTTPTRKIKRKHMYEMFRDLIESMYASNEQEIRV